MKRNTIHLVLLIALLASLLMIRNTAVAQSGTPEEPRYFPETGYSIKGVFRRYWESQGGLTVFGYPISGQAKAVNPADGKLYETQWFERHRMEYHPELANDANYYILLGLLGQELAKTSISASVTPSNLLQGNCRSVEGVQVCGRFRTYWDAFGLNFGPNETYRNSLALHGKPISPVVTTQIEGKSYQVQWFERARFEWHGPGSVDTKPVGAVPGSFDVLFGLLGNAMRPKNFTAETSLPYAEQLTMQRANNNRGSLNYNAAAPVQLQASAGTDMMLVPPLTPPSISPEELIANPSRLSGVVIGGLRVVSALPDIPVGIYVVTLRDDGNALRLEGESGHVVELPAVIRKLALGYLVPTSTVAALPADAARKLGFNRQICYGWEQTQICGLFNADQVTQSGFSALAGRQVDTSQTLPLVAGAAPLDQCVRGLAPSTPDYRSCISIVLATPASSPTSFQTDDSAADLGIVDVSSDLADQVYSDAHLKSPVDVLPSGSYQVEALVLAGDTALPNGGTYSRVRLSGQAGTFFMPAIVGVTAVGAPLSEHASGTAPSLISVGTSLILRDTCFFKVAQCPVDFAGTVAPLPTPSPTPLPVPLPITPGSVFGIDSNIASRHPNYDSLQAPADVVANLGVGWAREDFQFKRIMPTSNPSSWNWDWHNRTVDLLSQRGVQIIGLLNRPTPGWANGQRAENVPPDPETFAAFAKEVVTRYKDRVHYWQVWNEPDNAAYWSPRPDPAAYAALLKATYQAIKAADPSAHVLSAGLVSPEPAGEFLRQLQANGAWDSFDILALNPYADPKSPERGQIDTEGVGMARGLASVFGSKPIWVTEFGWATSPADRTAVQVDEQTQAIYLVRSMALLRAAGAERALWYNLKDSDSPSWNLYGLVQYDSSGASYDSSLYKQAYSYFQVLNQQLRDTSVGTLIDLNDVRNVFDFEQAGTWKAIDQRSNGTLTQSSAQAHSGQSAGQLSYSFRTAGNDYVVFSPEMGITIPDGTSKLGLWVYGDGSANIVQARVRDSQGEVLQFRLGPVGAPEWHFISAPITGQVDFPASLDSLILDDDPNSTSGSGTIYLDDLTASVGSESYAVRFMKANEAVDVIWAPDSAQVTLPTSSDHVTRVRAWGETTEEPVSNGRYTFTAGPDPVYIHHMPVR